MTEKKLNQILENQERIEKRLENIEMLLVNLATSIGEKEGLFDVDFILDELEKHYKKLKTEVNIDKIDDYMQRNNMKQIQNYVRYAIPVDEGISILANITSEEQFEDLPVEEYVDVSFKYDLIQEKYADNHLFQKFLRDLEIEKDEDLPF